VSYAWKHNEANGEGNRDGAAENFSANYGAEGEATDPRIEAVRLRQIKNCLLTVAVSRGVPMLLGGDEFRRTQRGNNNAYCQDNHTSWVDWSLCDRHQELVEFVREILAFRRTHSVLRREAFYTEGDIQWFDPHGRAPDWFDPSQKRLACMVRGGEGTDLYLMFNAGAQRASFLLPTPAQARGWRLAIDTARPAMEDTAPESGVRTAERLYDLDSRASAILVAT
jgi:glycogen operon protein